VNPLTRAQRDALFWRTAFWLIVPPMFLVLCALTHYVHQRQGEIRHSVSVELQR
jgi:predicted MFS family arabinose efflux permease